MIWRRHARDAAATQWAGEQFAGVLVAGDIVLLEGPLGAGKTTFTQGVARGLGVSERVTSPTFTVVRQHRCAGRNGITTLHHADIYRVESLGEVVDLALGELAEESAVVVVEWGDLASSLFGTDVLSVVLTTHGDESRTIDVTGARSVGRESDLAAWSQS
jgi:tRNA threonylcarbamoyladenosine biosynthesis protein TsaE